MFITIFMFFILLDVTISIRESFRPLSVFRCAVSIVVEIIEEVIEEDGIGESEDDRPAGITAVVEKKLRWMQESYAELELKLRK